jgi:hypothetical protein
MLLELPDGGDRVARHGRGGKVAPGGAGEAGRRRAAATARPGTALANPEPFPPLTPRPPGDGRRVRLAGGTRRHPRRGAPGASPAHRPRPMRTTGTRQSPGQSPSARRPRTLAGRLATLPTTSSVQARSRSRRRSVSRPAAWGSHDHPSTDNGVRTAAKDAAYGTSPKAGATTPPPPKPITPWPRLGQKPAFTEHAGALGGAP